MSDGATSDRARTDAAPASVPTGTTAGALLRRARQAQGLHVAALAASIKVPPAKLEALEADQIDRLPDATFARALAQTVCRSLKIDPAPVLALLPPSVKGYRLEEVAEGLKMPFNERPGRLAPSEWMKLSGVTLSVAALLLIGAVTLYLMPPGWLTMPNLRLPRAASAPSSNVATEEAPPPAILSEAVPASAVEAPLPASAAPAAVTPAVESPPATAPIASAPAAAGALLFRTTAAAWIGVTDATGKALIGRLVQPGEDVALDGASPFALKVGNANAVRLSFRGEPFDLARYTRDNVARLQLK